MKRASLSTLTALLIMGLALTSQAVEILRWERLPLTVPLVVGHERVIFIDRNVRVGVPASVGDRLRMQSAGGVLYLHASEPIEPTRLQVQDADTGTLILLDVFAEPGDGPLEPVRIVEGELAATRYGADESVIGPEPVATTRPARETPIAVVLTRHAAQSLYAPLRNVDAVNGIRRAALRQDLALDSLFPTLPVRAKALAAWRLEDQWVMAVRLTNTTAQWIGLDPRALQGDFLTATFQHPDLGPAGEPTDTTVVYLVTRGRGLAESLLPTISPIDASLNLPVSNLAGPAEGAGDAQ
jgi:integrating conjugative element protein (TIGR03749 family)